MCMQIKHIEYCGGPVYVSVPSCPEGYEVIGPGCYNFSTSPYNFDEANEECGRLSPGGHLAVAQSRQHLQQIRERMLEAMGDAMNDSVPGWEGENQYSLYCTLTMCSKTGGHLHILPGKYAVSRCFCNIGS